MNIGVHISFQVDIFVFYKSFFFPISSRTFVICCLLDDNYSCRWEVISHCGFDLRFFDILLSIFSRACWPSVCPFEKIAIHVLCIFLIRLLGFLMLTCMSCLCILDINPLSIILFANIFSSSVVCLFVL